MRLGLSVLSVAACLVLGACSRSPQTSQLANAEPDPDATPGTLCSDSDQYFDGYRYPDQVAHCKRHVTKGMKEQISDTYGVDESDWSDYEFDHFLPLGIGGSTDIDNLWPQPLDEAKVKDKLENELYRELAAGDISQDDAVQQIRDAWGATFRARRAARQAKTR